MDSITLTQLFNKIHTYQGLGKLNIFFENRNLNKPLQWWLKEIDKTPATDLDRTSFINTYKQLSTKKLHSIERLNELLNWIFDNKLKFKKALETNELSKFRSFILSKEKQLKDDQTGQIELDFYDFLLDAEDSDKEWDKILKTIKENSLKIENIRRSDEHDLGVIIGKISDIKKFLEWYSGGSGLEHEYFDFIEPVEHKKTKKTAKATLDAYRVVYGKQNTPLQDREYKIKGQSAVGSVSEFIDHFGDHYGKIVFYNTSGDKIEQTWENISGNWKQI